MKKTLSIFLILLIFLSVSGCSEPVRTPETSAETEQTTANQEKTETEEEETEPVETRKYELSEKGKRYYFAVDGDDINTGDSEEKPWKSLSKLEKITLNPGDRVLLHRGDTFNERLTVRGNGEADAWIYIGGYGEGAKPRIALNNDKNDIAILCDDNKTGLNYIWIDGLETADSLLGIYFRYTESTDNRGVRVTNCRFDNINCPELMKEALSGVDFLGEKKADLDENGGAYEYIWPTAINIGGRPPLPLASVTIKGVCAPATVVSNITVEDCEFYSTIVAVGANCYNYHYGTGENQFREYTKNWSVRNLYSKNTMTMFNFDACTFGYDGSEKSEYGIFENIICDSGMENYSMSAGTTLALFSSCCDLYVKNSRFSGCKNNGYPDGCGFDFERDDHNITLYNCVIDNNEGQGVLVMETVLYDQVSKTEQHTPSTNCKIINCLFYNNMKNVYGENYKYDVTVFNANNENFTVSDNVFYYREYTGGAAHVKINKANSKYSPVGTVKKGFIMDNNEMILCKDESELPDINALISDKGIFIRRS